MKKTLLIISLFVSIQFSIAQNTTVSGTVSDSESSEVIPGANVIIKGKPTGTVTDGSGHFELITSVKFPLTIVISVVGYQKQELEISDNSSPVSVNLSPASVIMDEVVFSASRVEENILQSPVSIDHRSEPSIT